METHYGTYITAYFILDNLITDKYKLSVSEIEEYAQNSLDRDLILINLDTELSSAPTDLIEVPFGSLLGFQFQSENELIAVSTRSEMFGDGLISMQEFVPHVYDEQTGLTNFFFALKPVTEDGSSA